MWSFKNIIAVIQLMPSIRREEPSAAAAGPSPAPDCQPSDQKQPPWAVRMADSVLKHSPDLLLYNDAPKIKWKYDFAMLGMAIDKLGSKEKYESYSSYNSHFVNYFIEADGSILMYDIEKYNLDYVNPAKNLITLYERTGEERYEMAIELIVSQLEEQPRTNSGGFFHKLRYPYQMWLDGIYMASPFMAQYASVFDEPKWADEAVYQISHIYNKTRDEESGLLYHAWQETREEAWSDPISGCSPNFWGRAMGWYAMSLADTLDYLPEEHKGRDRIIAILNEVVSSLMKVRDEESKLWYQVLDMGDKEGNYLEASASAMYVYVFAKASKKGYISSEFFDYAMESFDGMLDEFIKVDDDGMVSMQNIVGGTGLGGDPYRDGSFEYYISEDIIENDAKGVGPFILAAMELDR
mmetsp:Transcript_1620/g.3128  ORF Transcript_1620/g.3128 Transcript_1620/m.3128 type:complete len:409 (+) Transcript_1620:84-1310(+)